MLVQRYLARPLARWSCAGIGRPRTLGPPRRLGCSRTLGTGQRPVGMVQRGVRFLSMGKRPDLLALRSQPVRHAIQPRSAPMRIGGRLAQVLPRSSRNNAATASAQVLGFSVQIFLRGWSDGRCPLIGPRCEPFLLRAPFFVERSTCSLQDVCWVGCRSFGHALVLGKLKGNRHAPHKGSDDPASHEDSESKDEGR